MKITHIFLRKALLSSLVSGIIALTGTLTAQTPSITLKEVEGTAPTSFVFDYQVLDVDTQQYITKQYYLDFTGNFGETSATNNFSYDWQYSNEIYSLKAPADVSNPDIRFSTTNNSRITLTSASTSVYDRNIAGKSGYNTGGAINVNGEGVGTSSDPMLVGDFTGDFFNNSVNDNGGAIYLHKAKAENISGNYVGNKTVSGSGGAVYLLDGSGADLISGYFAGNSANDWGGAVQLTQLNKVGTISGDFTGNSAGSNGGAIGIHSGSTVETIEANFIANKAIRGHGGAIAFNGISKITTLLKGTFNSNSSYSSGGAISMSSLVDATEGSYIKSIEADFIGNTSGVHGGAIALVNANSIGSIIGDFINNSTTGANSDIVESDGSDAGAILIQGATIDSITGNFIGNSAHDHGGAIHSIGTTGRIDSIIGNFTNNSSGEHGGAIMNAAATLSSITGNFTGNRSAGFGGAIYNSSNGTINLLAAAEGIRFSENKSTTGDANNDDTIFNDNAIISFDASAGDITVNGSISATDETSQRGTLNINAGTVAFNSQVYNQNVTVSAGVLSLGNYTNEANRTYSALLSSSIVTLNSTATLKAVSANSLGTGSNTISANNSAEIHLEGGTLSNKVTLSDTALLMVASGVTLNSQLEFNNTAMIMDASRNLGHLDAVTIGANASITGETVALNNSAINFNNPNPPSSIVLDSESLNVYDIKTNIDISSVSGTLVLNVNIADTTSFIADYFYGGPPALAFYLEDMNVLSTNVFGDSYDYSSNVSFNFNGIIGQVTGAQDYDNGILFTVSIPEPSTASLSLLALAGLLLRRRRKA